ncbi:MAG TPA: hypothetical protein VKT81_19700 [Bryobacteraceae bacterium]|nr:hypothetical protein [Bryobacteraceae bacterium]
MRIITRWFIGSAIGIFLAFAQSQDVWRDIDGRVVDDTGVGVADAMVVASGSGFRGWAAVKEDGSFHLRTAGLFLSIRHSGSKAVLLRTADLTQPVRIILDQASESTRKMPPCDSNRQIGGALRIDPGRHRHKGPVNGEHDFHWYVSIDNSTLHIVDGYAWHAGLPLEEWLSGSESISVASWEFENIVGLDLSGRTRDGKRWRWLGAPIADAIEYHEATPEAADVFDGIMKSACFGSDTFLKK